jgi:hypothetical protein
MPQWGHGLLVVVQLLVQELPLPLSFNEKPNT